MVQFDSFSIPQTVLRALADMGFTEASPIQAAAIPPLLEGRDVLAQAHTGTGKTAAFGIPLVAAAASRDARALVLVPTRELAQQVSAELDRIGAHAGVKALPVYGGAAFGPQARALGQGGFGIVVATPGRLRDHIARGTIDVSQASLIVLDEADEMLNMGFVEEVDAILDAVGPTRQTMLFSATLPDAVARLAQRHLKDAQRIVAKAERDTVTTANIERVAIEVEHREKTDALVRILAVERATGVIVFRHTRDGVDDLVKQLRTRGLAAEALHGGMAQERREDVLQRLRDGRGALLVATDVAARGLDVERVSLVVNYDAPRQADDFVHRIGRTGRAGRAGLSILFATRGDRGRVRGIERALRQPFAWRDVPTDADVHEGIRAHARTWLQEQVATADAASLALVDDVLAQGVDARMLAAALVGRVALAEGLVAPPLEPRVPARPRRMAQPARPADPSGPRAAVMLSVGREDGLRPADVVGALANEAGLTGQDVGRIDILPRMAVADVPASRLEDIFAACERGMTIRGRPVQARVAKDWRFRESSPGPRRVHARA